MNEEVSSYIGELGAVWQRELAEELRQLVHRVIPEAQERIQYKKPHFLKNGKYAAVISPAKGWVSFTIFNAAGLSIPDGVFEDGPEERRTVKIREGKPADFELLAALLKQASDGL